MKTKINSLLEQNKPESFVNIGNCAFGRRGSYMAFFPESNFVRVDGSYGRSKIFLGSLRGAAAMNNDFRLYNINPTYQGEKVPCAIKTTPTELIFITMYGEIKICFPEPNLILVKSDDGLGVQLETKLGIHAVAKPRKDEAWETLFRWVCSIILKPIKGTLKVDAPWRWEELSTPRVQADFIPDKNGSLLFAMEEFTYSGYVRDTYPSYEEGLESVTKDWEEFLGKIAPLPEPYESRREQAAWVLWSHLVDPSGLIKRPLMYMVRNSVASAWQMCEQAMALHGDLSLSVELLLNQFDMANEIGQIPDFYDDFRGIYHLIKPPLQGFALKWLMKRHDLTEIPKDKLTDLYNGFSKWADWFFIYRDDDNDGIPQFEHGDEEGCDDTSVYKYNMIMETPSLSSYLVLLLEAVGDLAKAIGKEEEADRWYERAKTLLNKMIDTFWNGERFIAMTSGTHEVVATDSLLYYLPIVLGKRLPDEIINKMAKDLEEENSFMTPYGLASEKLSSKYFNLAGFANGGILASLNLLIVVGLDDAGKTSLAKKIAKRFCDGVNESGFTIIGDPFGSQFGIWTSWTAGVYLVLAEYCKD